VRIFRVPTYEEFFSQKIFDTRSKKFSAGRGTHAYNNHRFTLVEQSPGVATDRVTDATVTRPACQSFVFYYNSAVLRGSLFGVSL